jgi:hypothetical protein
MALYQYRHGDDVIEEVFDMGEAPKVLRRGGKTYARDFHGEMFGGTATAGWPVVSEGSAVHPSQAQELRDFLKKKGVPTQVTPDGRPIYTSRRHMVDALRARNMHNKSEISGGSSRTMEGCSYE